MYRSMGWTRAQAAKFLHVSERTLHNWESGRHEVPYAAYKLLRIHCGMELPGSQWRGWSISGGKLWTPEGYGLTPSDAAWWSLLARRAEIGAKAITALRALRAPWRAREAAPATGYGRAAPEAGGGGADLAPHAGAASGAAAQPTRGLVLSKTTETEIMSKTIATYNHTIFSYTFDSKGVV